MTRPKGQQRFAEMKRMIKLTDARLKAKDRLKPKNHEKKTGEEIHRRNQREDGGTRVIGALLQIQHSTR